tara:strand:+ start:4769 stop:7123 length:2355 start_codon:yes stop_codon:yes gene_type:complete
MRFFLALVLFLPFNSFAQSSLEYFNSLPEEIQNQITEGERDFETLQIEDSFIEEEEIKEEEEIVEEPFFGYNFFNKSSETNAPVLDIPLQSDYIISFNDELELLLTGNVNELLKLRVDLSGNILVPEVGSIAVLNLNLSQANTKISELINNSYVGTTANLSVVKPSLKKISVIGSVTKPGSYLVNPFISISEAIKYADGLLENASIRKIQILKADGTSSTFDLYKFLVFGDRSIDINLQNGDTVLVSATSNYVEVDGEVLRPNKYEYLPTDTISDLISYAQGLTNTANDENIFINALDDSQIKSYSIAKDEVIGKLQIESLNVGSIVSVSRKNVFVVGESVTSGYFDYEEGELVADFLNKLSFSNNIYPFYFIISQDSGAGLQTEYFNLSLADPNSYENIKLAQNVNFEFFSKDQIIKLNELNDKAATIQTNYSSELSINPFLEELDMQSELEITEENYTEWERLKVSLPKDKISVISIGERSLSIPLAGRITAQSLYDYLGFNVEIDTSNVSVATREKIELEAFSKPFNAKDVLSITLPPTQYQTLGVTISGNIAAPGTYIVPIKTTLDDLYEIAGGVLSGASYKGIVLSREAVKELERKALEGAKRVIMDSVVSQQANALALGNNSNVDLSTFTALMAETTVTGRVTGDFAPGSISSQQTILQDGDEIFIPSIISTITVTGEVLNPITTGFENDSTYEDYIEAAGGFTSFADTGSIYIIKSNGTSIKYSKGFMVKNQYPEPGDTIVIPRDYDQIQGLPLVSVATKIISDIAFAAASLNSISN